MAALAGFVPVLAVHAKGPVPVEVNVILSPRQMIVLDGVILTDNVGVTETVATACAVQAPVPERTE